MSNKMKCRIVSIGKNDAYYPNRGDIVGALVEIDTTLDYDLKEYSGGATYIGRKILQWEYQNEIVEFHKGDFFFFHTVELRKVSK